MSNPNKGGATGFIRLWRAAGYSWAGLRAAYGGEAAFRQEVWLACLLLPLALLLPVTLGLKAVLLASVLLVLAVELLNSALEAVVDLASPEYASLAKRAKDLGSAAVLVSLLAAAASWVCALVSLLNN